MEETTDMKMAIVGSHTFPMMQGAGYILGAVARLQPGDTVLVRPTEGVDYMAQVFAHVKQLDVKVYPTSGPRGDVFRRDMELVDDADAVTAFFDPNAIMEGGTAHIVEVALRKGKPVEVWTVEDGELVRVGEHE
jgi:hypothetical protein